MGVILLSKSQMKAIVSGDGGGSTVIDDPLRRCECNEGTTGHLCHNDNDCVKQDGPGCWCQLVSL